MITEALKYLTDRYLAQNVPQTVDVKGPADRKTYIMPDGEVKVVVGEPTLLSAHADTLESFADLCGKHEVDDVQFREDSIVGLVDREGRERITYRLGKSEEYTALTSMLAQTKDMDQGIPSKDLCFYLRSTFRNCFGENARASLLKKFGTLKVASLEDASRVSSRTQDTMGASIDRQVAPDVELPPETIVFQTTVYDAVDAGNLRAPVPVYVEPNLDRKTWVLVPLPGVFKSAEQDVRSRLAGKLQVLLGEGITVHH